MSRRRREPDWASLEGLKEHLVRSREGGRVEDVGPNPPWMAEELSRIAEFYGFPRPGLMPPETIEAAHTAISRASNTGWAPPWTPAGEHPIDGVCWGDGYERAWEQEFERVQRQLFGIGNAHVPGMAAAMAAARGSDR